jgi:hypothetical protein
MHSSLIGVYGRRTGKKRPVGVCWVRIAPVGTVSFMLSMPCPKRTSARTPLTSPSPPRIVKVIFLVSWFSYSILEEVRCLEDSMLYGNESVLVISLVGIRAFDNDGASQ